ncbi:hypothetical protein TWF718_003230 [Orbilia javanica]|uniref:Rad4-domain-containing protein n=1 Tax=Orbilia javanica TaxID=47235 RepID=A0AAN8R9J7_9PEZI
MPPKRQQKVRELPPDVSQLSPPNDEHIRKRRKIERGFRKAIGQPVLDDGSSEDSDSDNGSTSSDGDENPQTGSRDLEHEGSDADEKEEDWEVLLDTTKPADYRKLGPPKPSESLEDGDLVLTLDKSYNPSLPLKKKGPSSRERRERLYTHVVHVICLMYHGHRRNVWLNDEELQKAVLKSVEGTGAKKGVEMYLNFVNPQKPSSSSRATAKGGKKTKKKRKKKGTDNESQKRPASPHPESLARPPLDPGGTDTKLVEVLGLLMRLWRKRFHIDAPGLRKRGYSENITEAISADKENQVEKIQGLDDFRQRAKDLRGSRDTGAQLFTALLRALGFEARLVFSICPLGYGFSKAEMRESDEMCFPEASISKVESSTESSVYDSSSDSEPSTRKQGTSRQGRTGTAKAYDKDLKFPTFWTEVYSPMTERWIAIDTLVTGLILSSNEDMSKFEPKGLLASKYKQQISYVIAYNADKSARDVTIRYLHKMAFPGKTKGLRMPMFEREVFSNQGDLIMVEKFDLFSERILKCFHPCGGVNTAKDLKEDEELLVKPPIEPPSLLGIDFPKSVAGYKNHIKYVLERHLKREDCVLPGELPVHTLVTGKPGAEKDEKVYSRQSIIVGKPAENWYREGRVIKPNEQPLKQVPSRAVTINRKREIEDAKREGDSEAGLVGLYGFYQTELYQPPAITDGVIPKNAYGNIDCFVPSMIPEGAAHIPWKNAARLCRRLGIEFSEAVTGFDFKNKRAVPRIEGVLCSEENADVLTEACRQDDEQRRLKEDGKRQQICLALWKKFLIGLRIVERIEEDYGSAAIEPVQNFDDSLGPEQEATVDSGSNRDLEEGGFLRE